MTEDIKFWRHWAVLGLWYTKLLVFLRRHAIDVQLFSHSSQRRLVRISLCQDRGTEEGFPFLSSLFQKEESKFTFTSKIFHILFSPGSHIYPTIQSNSSSLVLWAVSGTHFSCHGEMPTCALPVVTFFILKVWSWSLWCLPHALQLPALLVKVFFYVSLTLTNNDMETY